MKWLAIIAVAASPLFAQTRMASDFEIAQMKQQIATSHDFLSQLSGHLNLGDLYVTRSETTTARAEYEKALQIAGSEALAARKGSDITRYATAVAYSALAHAKLGHDVAAFNAAEEAIRYTSGSAKSWNLYSTAMALLHKRVQAMRAARNAVEITRREVEQAPTVSNRLDLAVYRYTLASALMDEGDPTGEGYQLLFWIDRDLNGMSFEALRRHIAAHEGFQIYSSARGDEAAYISVLNRTRLRIAAHMEKLGYTARAREEYESVLASRTDDPTALAALARLADTEEKDRYFPPAFDANPFSMPLIRAYQEYLRTKEKPAMDLSTTGGRVRIALIQMHRGEMRGAQLTLDRLLREYPDNDTLRALRQETESKINVRPALLASSRMILAPSTADLHQLLALLISDKLTPEQRASLDTILYKSAVVFDSATPANAQTIFSSGLIDDVRFRFSEPTAFAGHLPTHVNLTYRILGATEVDGADALLLEPAKVEP